MKSANLDQSPLTQPNQHPSTLARSMPILYALVSRGSCVLAEFTSSSGNFTTVARKILEKVAPYDSKMSYIYDDYIFHYIVADGLTYMCMADESFGRRRPFSFLEDIKERFTASYGEKGRTALTYGMNEDFSRVLQRQMTYFSSDNSDSVSKVRNDIDDVTNVVVQNIEKVLHRGDRLELLVNKTSELNTEAFTFKQNSEKLKNALWWKNIKIVVVVLLVLSVIFSIAFIVVCWKFGCYIYVGEAFVAIQGAIAKLMPWNHSSDSSSSGSHHSHESSSAAPPPPSPSSSGNLTRAVGGEGWQVEPANEPDLLVALWNLLRR